MDTCQNTPHLLGKQKVGVFIFSTIYFHFSSHTENRTKVGGEFRSESAIMPLSETSYSLKPYGGAEGQGSDHK